MVCSFTNLRLPHSYAFGFRVVSFSDCEETSGMLSEKGLDGFRIVDNQSVLFSFGYEMQLCTGLSEIMKDIVPLDSFLILEDGSFIPSYREKDEDFTLFLSSKCNSNCLMCPSSEYSRRFGTGPDAEQAMLIARHIPTRAKHITITGGEPFLFNGLIDILRYFKEDAYHGPILLLTNGRALSIESVFNRFREAVPSHLIAAVPLHAPNPELHDFITQAEGSFIQTCKGISNLISIGCNVEIRIVVSKMNAKCLLDICRLISQRFIGVLRVVFVGLEMSGNAARNNESVWIDYWESFPAMKAGIDFLIEKGIDVLVYNYPLCSVEERYRCLCRKSISEGKVRFFPACSGCSMKRSCGGFFQSAMHYCRERMSKIC